MFAENINIQICNKKNGEALDSVMVMLTLFARHKNNYDILLPLSNEKGNINITKHWLSKEVEKARSLFPMDYASDLDDCDTTFAISILDTDSIKRVIKAMELYQNVRSISNIEISDYANNNNYKFISKRKMFCAETQQLNIEIHLEMKQ